MPRRYKKSYKRGRRNVGKRYFKKKIRKMRAMGMNFVKLRADPDVVSTSGGTVDYRVSLTDLAFPYNPNQAGFSGTVQDFNNFSSVYDQYRVYGVKLQFIPDAGMDETDLTQFRPIYIFTDFDSNNQAMTNATAIQYERMKFKDLRRPWSYYVRVPKMANTTNVGGVGSVQVGSGWFDVAAPLPTGSIYVYTAAGLKASTHFGRLLITYYVGFKGRR